MLLLLCSSPLMAETIEGKLGEFYFNGDTITLNGKAIKCNMEATRVFYSGQYIGEEDLTVGDEVQLVFSDDIKAGELKKLEFIILLKGRKQGLES